MNDDIGGSGYSLDDLSAYLDRGRTPAIAAIDRNPECQALLDAMARFGALSHELVDREGAEQPPTAGWLDGLLDTVAQEVRAGRDLPYAEGLVVTEGAVRTLVREAGDAVPGALVGRTRIREQGELTRIEIELSVLGDRPLVAVGDQVRDAVAEALRRHTPLGDAVIDVTIVDVHPANGAEG
jgi:hypothetical protein